MNRTANGFGNPNNFADSGLLVTSSTQPIPPEPSPPFTQRLKRCAILRAGMSWVGDTRRRDAPIAQLDFPKLIIRLDLAKLASQVSRVRLIRELQPGIAQANRRVPVLSVLRLPARYARRSAWDSTMHSGGDLGVVEIECG